MSQNFWKGRSSGPSVGLDGRSRPGEKVQCLRYDTNFDYSKYEWLPGKLELLRGVGIIGTGLGAFQALLAMHHCERVRAGPFCSGGGEEENEDDLSNAIVAQGGVYYHAIDFFKLVVESTSE